ncbi:hypothetical protein MMC17_002905 [Xylographa soralifera]|nr:hypothetical protein [Xylographa soralifera]
MDFSEDTQSSMNMDEDFWALPDILDIPASIFDAWLPDLEDHGGRTPLLEMTNPQGLDGNNGLEQSAVAVADFDIDSDALMGNLESIDIMQDISSPNWLHTFLDELDNEAISHSVRSHSSYYSRRRTRHTQLSSALLNRTPTESDHEQNIPLVVSATGTTPRVNGRYLHGLGKQCVENSERVMSSLMGLDSLQSFELELVENLATSRLDSGLLSRNICYSKLRDQVNNYETQIYEMKDGRKACLEESTAAQTSGTRQFKTRDVAAMETIAPSIDKWLDEVWTLSVPFITIQAHKSLSPPISPAASLTCRLIYLPRPPSDPNSDVPDDFEDSLFVVSSDQDDTYRYARSAAVRVTHHMHRGKAEKVVPKAPERKTLK